MNRKIFKKIAERQAQGLMFHSDMADYYQFLNLNLFKDFHTKQFMEECNNFRKIKEYFIHETHQTLVLTDISLPENITPIEWEDKTSMDVDKDSIKVLLKKSLETYLDWEKDTCSIYKEQAEQLFQMGYYDDYCFMRDIIDGVWHEINHINSLMVDLSVVDFDITKVKGLKYKL